MGVAKKDGETRWAVDFRALNAVTIADSFPVPSMGEVLMDLAGAKYFSSLDAAQESAIVTALRALKSTAQRVSPSFLATGTSGDPQGDSAGAITPSLSHESIWARRLAF